MHFSTKVPTQITVLNTVTAREHMLHGMKLCLKNSTRGLKLYYKKLNAQLRPFQTKHCVQRSQAAPSAREEHGHNITCVCTKNLEYAICYRYQMQPSPSYLSPIIHEPDTMESTRAGILTLLLLLLLVHPVICENKEVCVLCIFQS